ncbi:sigma-54-dependent transcriptional regulator [Barrientosiimonas marina]|uniref:Sigma 54-interacting transcriptional regulator n=1 Tax=Lentibacillus kimchii TaxID=1542911 RepID=A0ABW2UXK9_9BACI
MSRILDIYQQVQKAGSIGATAEEIGDDLQINRSTASRYLNDLVKADRVEKLPGKPVKYMTRQQVPADSVKQEVIGSKDSLKPLFETGMAAFLYPVRSLPILLTGETGTGKSYLAEKLSYMAIENAGDSADTPFIAFNCADYAQNPELLVGQIFGIKKGAFTGADEDKTGLAEQADGGILFLDEIHRLPPSGQEMLFYLIDKGIYHRLGEATRERHANVALIGATTEDSENYLLSTLLRRFSVKLDVPPLRKRKDSERQALIDYFLTEEAAKMSVDLSLEDDCREAFLSYDCPGNIGQLKSDMQIACARAYLRYLNSEDDQVFVKLEDFPGNNPVQSDFQLQNQSFNDKQEQLSQELADPFPNIYQRLDDTQNKDEHQLQEVVMSYIHELTERYRQPALSQDSWQNMIDYDLLNSLFSAADRLRKILPFTISQGQLYIIGLHLQHYRNHLHDNEQTESIPAVRHPNASYRQAANYIADQLNLKIGIDLPNEEIELLAHFLSTDHQLGNDRPIEQMVAVVLVTHGESTASSMAEVTNYLLGNNVVHPIDMPLNQSAEETYDRVKQVINRMSDITGVLLLVDIGSLITMGDTIQNDLQVPIKTLSSVNLPMILEAGRQSLTTEQSLDMIYEKAKSAMLTFMEKEHQTTPQKKRLIVTVCFTGEGAAQLLESWLENQLSAADEDVLIRSVRIDPETKDTSVLNGLKTYYDVVAIIGTVPVSIEGVPYIPAWELLQTEGISRMHKLLEITRKSAMPEIKGEVAKDEIYGLVIQGLQEIVTYINPRAIAELLQKHIPRIRRYYDWDSSHELGMWMHIGSLLDRMVSAIVQQNHDQLLSSFPVSRETVISADEQQIWQPLFDQTEQAFSVVLTDYIKRELVKLSR